MTQERRFLETAKGQASSPPGEARGLVYMAENVGDNPERGWLYFGQTIRSLKERKREHLKTARTGYRAGDFQKAIRRWGEDSFEWSVVQCGMALDDSLNFEREMICMHDTCHGDGYNSSEGGSGGGRKTERTRARISAAHKGRRHSAETRAKMSAAKKGMKFSKEHRAKLSAANKRRPPFSAEVRARMSAGQKRRQRRNPTSAETKAKLSAAMMGREVSPETRAKMSAAKKGRKFSEEHKDNMSAALAKMIGVPCFADGVRHESIASASRANGCSPGTIRGRIKRGVPGYRWADKEDS